MSKKVFTIVGARPQFVKAAVVSRALKAAGINEVLVHTGQHFDHGMSKVFFDEMEIPEPNYNLGINSLSHGAMTGRMLEEIEKVLVNEQPDYVVVFGDTNSTLAGALAATKLHIPVAHVEAGLRSFNMEMPEEINRILTDRISNILFCPTDSAVNNLNAEGFDTFKHARVIKSGDVMYDAALFYSKKSAQVSTVINDNSIEAPYILATLHRQENTDDIEKLQSIIRAFNAINRKINIVLPLHPRTRAIIKQHKLTINCKVIDPVGYFDMIELIKHSSLVMTDSGGLQKEAYFFKKNCVTLREQTEWVELVENGYNVLAGSDEILIKQQVEKMLQQNNNFDIELYGNGDSGKKIAGIISNS